jgi:hypothetical protein
MAVAYSAYMPIQMRRVIGLLLVVLSLTAMTCSQLWEKPAHLTKDLTVAYRAELQSYADILKPGVTRVKVEEYLRSKGVEFRQMHMPI